MFCTSCGSQIPEGAAFCSVCGKGVSVQSESTQSVLVQAESVKPKQEDEKDQYLWGLVGCCMPIAGLILFILWRDDKPITTKALAIGSVIGTVLGTAGYASISILAGIVEAFA